MPQSESVASERIEMKRRFAAGVDRVYRAWSEPAELQRWAWGSLGKDVRATVDLRLGGVYRIETSRPDGTTWAFGGSYTEIVPNGRLSYTLRWDAPMGYPSVEERVTVEFVADGDGAMILFLHEGVPSSDARAEHARGWSNTFDTLSRLLEETRPSRADV